MLRPWSQQARQPTPRGGTVARLGNRGRCVHIHTGNLSILTHFVGACGRHQSVRRRADGVPQLGAHRPIVGQAAGIQQERSNPEILRGEIISIIKVWHARIRASDVPAIPFLT